MYLARQRRDQAQIRSDLVGFAVRMGLMGQTLLQATTTTTRNQSRSIEGLRPYGCVLDIFINNNELFEMQRPSSPSFWLRERNVRQ